MKQIVSIPDDTSNAEYDRPAIFAEFLKRRTRIEGDSTLDSPADARLALEMLAKKRLLSFERKASVEVMYIPSRQSIEALKSASSIEWWPESIQKKHLETLRTSQGAIFHFPREQGEGNLDVFITDWSPCPAAGAVAVHRYHPFVTEVRKKDGAFFTGEFVRHPLTGDLLPVWVAEWVKPEFGTGAVLVNPAHDRTDLAFGRAVGLPIRFALVPESFDGNPDTWPTPPIIKTGRSIKTGFFDGLSFDQALEKYFDRLEGNGLAERYFDVQAGKRAIATIASDPEGDLFWCENCGNIIVRGQEKDALCNRCSMPMAATRLQSTKLLDILSAIQPDASLSLLCPTTEQEGTLLFLRLLFFDLNQRSLEPAEFYIIQKVQETKVPASLQVLALSALVGNQINQIVVMKQQIIEQIQRFLSVHSEFLQMKEVSKIPADVSGPLWKAIQNTKAAILEDNPAKAFSFLYPLQKQLRSISVEDRSQEPAFAAYFALAAITVGVEHPETLDLERVWSEF